LQVPNALQFADALYNLILNPLLNRFVGHLSQIFQMTLPFLDFFNNSLEKILQLLILLAFYRCL